MKRLEKYTLTWHNYSDHLREALQEMMSTSDFADVTLVTDDKQQIRAHRSILSTCSPVFKNILQYDNNNTNPVIYLRGIQHSEMESVMQFVYLGEARFYEERLSEFLMVSKNLEIKDLLTGLENIEMNDQTEANTDSAKEDNNIANEKDLDINEDSKSSFNADVEPQTHTKLPNKSANGRTDLHSENGKFMCHNCDRIFNSQQALNYHIKSKHKGDKYACNECDYQATAQSSLKMHIEAIHHKDVKYACNQCDFRATQIGNLKTHVQSKHEGFKYACSHSQCEKQFTQHASLIRHFKREHL